MARDFYSNAPLSAPPPHSHFLHPITSLLSLSLSLYSSYRVIRDGPGSAVVFNGPSPLLDAMYTSTSNYITGDKALSHTQDNYRSDYVNTKCSVYTK